MIAYDVYCSIRQRKALGYSQRTTASELQVNRKTVNRYWEMTDAEFEAQLSVKEKLKRYAAIIRSMDEAGKTVSEITDYLCSELNEKVSIRSVSRFLLEDNGNVVMPKVLRSDKFCLNQKNYGDGLELLNDIIDGSISICFFDPEYKGVTDKLNYGNLGARMSDRFALPQMNEETIVAFISQIYRVLKPSGYLFLWVDKFHLCNGIRPWIKSTELHVVDLITWEKAKIGMGYRTRRKSEYLLILQKQPVLAKSTWVDHGIPDVWKETVNKDHPHSKPIQLQKRLILATTVSGDVVLDPCAGGYSVLEACYLAKRDYLGIDIIRS